MLLASSFILNQLSGPEEFTIHPYVLNTCNHVSEGDQMRGLEIPDRHPSEMVTGEGLLSMCAGDFAVSESYHHDSRQLSQHCVHITV